MDLIYGALGFVSKHTERLSRQSANLIPMNWLILFVAAALAVGGAFKLREAVNNRGAAPSVSVAGLLDGGTRYVGKHVAVAGALSKEGAFTWGQKDAKDPDAVYLPLVAPDADRALYVKAAPADVRALAGAGTVTGMVRKTDAKVRETMQSILTVPAPDGGFGRTVTVEQDLVLVANETPANPLLWGAVALAGGLLTLGMLLSIALRYVVFRRVGGDSSASGPPALGPTPMRPMRDGPPPVPAAPGAPQADAPRDLRVCGRFTYHENPKLRRRFVNIPAALAEMQSGDLGLVSNIDASVRFMGQVTKNRAGLWSVGIKPGTVAEIQDGLLYPGFRPRPALHFRFVDAQTGQPARAILSFPDPENRAIARRRLVAR